MLKSAIVNYTIEKVKNSPRRYFRSHTWKKDYRQQKASDALGFSGGTQNYHICQHSSSSSSSSSSSPLLSLVTSTSEISHQPVHTYTTYIWQWGRQNRKTGNVRKIQHLHEEREEENIFNPQTMLHLGVQSENRKKTPQHKSTYTINTWLATGGHIQLWQAAVRSSSHLLRRRSQTCSTGGGTKRSEAVDRGGE